MIFGKVDCVQRKNISGYVLFKQPLYRKGSETPEGLPDPTEN